MNTHRTLAETSRSFMGKFFGAWAALGLALALVGCRSSSAPAAAEIATGTYYARFNIKVDSQKCRSTNYRSPDFQTVAINTPVQLLSMDRRGFTLEVKDVPTFVFEPMRRHTKNTSAEAFESFFSSTPVDVSGFTSDEQSSIAAGEIGPGMSRAAVLAAIGPPPASGTGDINSKTWKYWNVTWGNDTFLVQFDDGGHVLKIIE